MKKLYTLLAVVLMGSLTVSAQLDMKQGFGKNKMTASSALKSKNQLSNARQSNGANHTATTVWTDDFSTPANWVLDHQAGTVGDWVIGTTGPSGAFAIPAITSTTAANGFALFDSDLICSFDQVANLTTASSIDCSSLTSARLNFSQYYRRFYDSTYVFISNDGTTWNRFEVNGDLIVNEFSAHDMNVNPEIVHVDISSVAAGQATVWVRFQFYSPNSLAVDTSGCAYAWMIDDVSIEDLPGYDMSTLGVLAPFTGCQLGSAETITTAFINKGTSVVNSFDASFTVNGGAPTTETVTSTMNPGDTLVYTFTATADLSAVNTYDVAVYATIAGDADNTNDTAHAITASALNTVPYTMGFEPTEDFNAYSIDDVDGDGVVVDFSTTYTHSGTVCARFPYTGAVADDNWLFTSCFELTGNDVYSLDFFTKAFDVTGVPYSVEAYVGDAPSAASATTLIVAAPVPTDTTYQNVHGTFSVPTTGTYFIGFRAFGTGVTASQRLDDITVDFVSGIKGTDLVGSLAVYPNPSTGMIYVQNNNLLDKTATVTVLNAVGQTVYTNNYNNLVKESINLSNQPNGLYTVRISTASGVVNKTVVISNN